MTHTALDDAMLDQEWLAAPTKRSRIRTILISVLAASVCFLGGAQVQKHFGADDSNSANGFAAPSGLPQSFSGSFPNGQSGTTPQGSGTESDTGSVIGKVVAIHGDTWTVKDLGGNRHTVTVGKDATVVRQSTVSSNSVKVGASVDISGTTSGSRLRADQVTLR